jgi:dolichol-phosphate mannosyltransferase
MFLSKLSIRRSGNASEKPLTQLFERAFDGEEREEAIQTLQSVAKQDGLVRRETGRGKFEKQVGILLSLGLVRNVTTPEGASCEITETGSRFLREYQQTEGGTSPDLRIEPDRLLAGIIKNKVTVVIPTLNEAEAIGKTIEEVSGEGYANILVVDGYSTDKTDQIVHANGVKMVYQHGTGKAGAVKTALERVETPYVVFMDGDNTYDAKDIWRLLNHSEQYSHVIGVRERQHIPRIHRFGNWVISQVFSLLFSVRVSDVCSGMYLLETNKAREYRLQESGFIAEIELAAHSASNGTMAEVPISYRRRIGSRKLNTWKHGIVILSAAFTLARRHNPILLYSGLATLSLVPAALALGWVGLEAVTGHGWHSGWAMLGLLFLLVAAQAFTLASVAILTRHMEERITRRIDAKSTGSKVAG